MGEMAKHSKRVTGDAMRRTAMWILASGVAAIAAIVSYSHIYDLGRAHGGTGVPAWLLPLSRSTCSILVGELMLLHEADTKGTPVRPRLGPRLVRHPRHLWPSQRRLRRPPSVSRGRCCGAGLPTRLSSPGQRAWWSVVMSARQWRASMATLKAILSAAPAKPLAIAVVSPAESALEPALPTDTAAPDTAAFEAPQAQARHYRPQEACESRPKCRRYRRTPETQAGSAPHPR